MSYSWKKFKGVEMSRDRRVNRLFDVVTGGEIYSGVKIKYSDGYLKIYLKDGSRVITNQPYVATQVVPKEEEAPKPEAPKED